MADKASGEIGWPSGPSTGAGLLGMSATTLYQWVGISDSDNRNLVWFMAVLYG